VADFAVSGAGFTDAVLSALMSSSLKSLAVGGGTLAGSGRGIAASIASSAALLRGVSPCARAEVADTVRKVAATAISTRSNPPRVFTQSRIVASLGCSVPPWNSVGCRPSASAQARLVRLVGLHATIHAQTIPAPHFCSQRHTGQLTTN
jgi:hypothetical protein